MITEAELEKLCRESYAMAAKRSGRECPSWDTLPPVQKRQWQRIVILNALRDGTVIPS